MAAVGLRGLDALVHEVLVDQRVGGEHRVDDAGDDVRTVQTAPEQQRHEQHDDDGTGPVVGQALHRGLDDLEDELGQRNAAEDLAHLVDDRGVAHDEEAGDHRGEGVRHAFGHGVGHLDAQVLLDAGGVDPRADQAHDDGGDDAVAAHPRVRQYVGDGGGVAAQRLDGVAGDRQRGGRDDEERDQRQDAAGDAVHLLVAGVGVADADGDDHREHVERGVVDLVETQIPIAAEDPGHEIGVAGDRQVCDQQEDRADERDRHGQHEAVLERGDGFGAREFHEHVKRLLRDVGEPFLHHRSPSLDICGLRSPHLLLYFQHGFSAFSYSIYFLLFE